MLVKNSQSLSVGKYYALLFVVLFGFFRLAMASEESGQSPIFDIDEKETQLAKKLAAREKEKAQPEFVYEVTTGYRVDELDWDIAIDELGAGSEVSWDNLKVPQIRFSGKAMLQHDWFIEGYYSTGSIVSGRASDSDFGTNGQAFSIMHSEAGGSVSDVSLAIGKKLNIKQDDDSNILRVSPLLGLSYHQQKVTMTDGEQVYPVESSIPQLDNGYSTEWNSMWLGLSTNYMLHSGIELTALIRFYKASYKARANWNLRNDLKHPVSFEHASNGRGAALSFGAKYYFSRNLYCGFAIERQAWKTREGKDRTYFSSGLTEQYTLSSVNWESEVYSLALGYQF